MPPTPARVLIVDDAAALRAVLRAFFTDEGYRMMGELSSGSGVLESIAHLRPDLVCLDYNLPGGNGLDLLKAIHVAHPEVAVIMITGDANADLEGRAAEAGAAGFLHKPFTQTSLSELVKQVLHTRNLQRQHGKQGALSAENARARAVVVDDNASMRMLLTSILNQAAVHVAAEAADGKQAIERVSECQPDIVCLDMDMPVMNGLEALEQIRINCPTARVLMITGHSGREAVMQAGKLGARGYILKPFEAKNVIMAINRLLG